MHLPRKWDDSFWFVFWIFFFVCVPCLCYYMQLFYAYWFSSPFFASIIVTLMTKLFKSHFLGFFSTNEIALRKAYYILGHCDFSGRDGDMTTDAVQDAEIKSTSWFDTVCSYKDKHSLHLSLVLVNIFLFNKNVRHYLSKMPTVSDIEQIFAPENASAFQEIHTHFIRQLKCFVQTSRQSKQIDIFGAFMYFGSTFFFLLINQFHLQKKIRIRIIKFVSKRWHIKTIEIYQKTGNKLAHIE